MEPDPHMGRYSSPSDAPKSAEEVKASNLAMLKAELRSFISEARFYNQDDKLRCRALSETITCAETAYLWLCQVLGDDTLLSF